MNPQLISDQELVKQYISGQNQPLSELLQRHKQRVFTSIYMLVKNRELAEDLFQDTFVKVIKTLRSGRYNEEGKFLPWVLRIAHNLTIDYFRKENRAPFINMPEEFDLFEILKIHDENAETRMIKNESHDKLRRLIDRLPREQKEVLVMRHYQDLSFKEISEITEVSINTALGRMRYALNNLRKLFEESGEVVPVK
ncbi:MAG: RNA polymerase sigma factor (sigma-70 family) [Sphingobacteriales bacterium]|jgi:RNA polymerase sigma factor (sigma-70 family)